MKAFIFPGQGCQKQGMGQELYENFPLAKELFERANDIIGRRISDIMFFGNELELSETINTQPAVFLYEVILSLCQTEVHPNIVAGHSLGEYAALVISKTISFEDGLNLVINRAIIAQRTCENTQTAMGAIVGLSDEYVTHRIKEITEETGEAIYFANYNGPGQVVISGTKKGIRIACKAFQSEGAKKAIPLLISGSFHTPFMADAELELGKIIESTNFSEPNVPIYQCVDALPHKDPVVIKANLIKHITHPVRWTEMMNNMVKDGVTEFYEVGPDDTLQKIVSRFYPDLKVKSLWESNAYSIINPFKNQTP